ncbi:hypothetical protein Franean1_0265 [Parafrankia sp. EAN1pec]|uniref:hypothetical protein n=1 Tax=Parafrankia sp. (strain EAN1pec) TaxID=298653 RepID=UPI00005427A1|nr:hypothetical protein Franean1_0265 [Frankia sp. EAN1pec]
MTTTENVVHDHRFTCGLCRLATEMVSEDEHRHHVEAFGRLGAADVELLDNLDAARALSDYVSRIFRIEACFDSWDNDQSLILFNSKSPGDVEPIGDVARRYLEMARTWYDAAAALADDLGAPYWVPGIPDNPLREITEAAIAEALSARNKVLVSWARLTLGTAGPTPTIVGEHVETDSTAVLVRGSALRTA